MDCIISATAARIIVVEGTDVRFIDADKPTVETSVSRSAIPYLIAGAHDVEFLKNTTLRAAFDRLLRNWNFDRALRMLDILADSESVTEEITLAGEYLEKFLEDPPLLEALENYAYALPLEKPDVLSNRLQYFQRRGRLCTFLAKLTDYQAEINKVRQSWDAVDGSNFRESTGRIEFEKSAVKCGAFKDFSFAIKNPSLLQDAVFKCHLSLKGELNSRAIISEWTRYFSIRPLKQRPKASDFSDDERVESEDAKLLARIESTYGSVHDRFTSAIKQQEGIIVQLERGNFGLARRFADQLVDWQLRNGGPQFAAKSLCSLAQEAKRLNNRSLQLEWVQRAVELAPRDARTHGQAGDAYLELLRLDEAKREYLAASSFSVEPFGATGLARVHRAQGKLDDALQDCIEIRERYSRHPEIYRVWALQSEILRDMWRLEDALALYAEGMKNFSEHSIFWCGYAAVLRDMGRLDEALKQYSAAADRFPNDPVARGGRADTLKNLGSLDLALSEYEAAAARFPNEPVLVCGKADVLRAMGSFEDAAESYRSAIALFPFEPAAYSGYADSVRDAGDTAESIRAYEEAAAKFPQDIRVRGGRAYTLKSAGRFDEALQAFDRNVRDFPYDLFSLVGRANLLKLLGRYESALEAYESIISRRSDYPMARYGKAAVFILMKQYASAEELLPKEDPMTVSDWIGYHIKGMMFLKRNELDRAIDIFEYGVKHNPFHRERQVFISSLAAAKIQARQFSQAQKLIEKVRTPISRVLQLHASAEIGDRQRALDALRAVNDNDPPGIVQLRNALAARYRFSEDRFDFDDRWIVEKETEVLLQAA